MDMSISDKEKKVLIFLGIFVGLFLYVYFFIVPKVKGINEIKSKISSYEQEYNINKEYITRVQNIDSELKILYEKQKALWKVLPPYINYDEALLILKDSAIKSNIQINDIQFENFTAKDVEGTKASGSSDSGNDSSNSEDTKGNETSDTSDNKNSGSDDTDSSKSVKDNKLVQAMNFFGMNDKKEEETSKAAIREGGGYYLPAKITASGTYDQLKEFIKIIKAKENKMEFDNINIENKLASILNISLRVCLFGIKDSSAKEYSIITDEKKEVVGKSGKGNIFAAIAGVNNKLLQTPKAPDNESKQAENTENSVAKKVGSYDFYISLLPFGNNLTPPSVTMLGKNIISDNDINIPTIYGDGNKYINVDVDVSEKDNKYYVKYRTEQDAFPDQAFAKTAEFKPIGDKIVLLINSINRKSKNDKSGIYLNAVNSTKKNFLVKIINDDKDNPRFKAGKLSNNVSLEFN